MKIISFHLKGKMAHFRKYYSNSSALSYFVPPRTTICGIIAGLLGLGRDSYYIDFSLDNLKIALSSEKPIKKAMQKMNYLMINSKNDLNGFQDYHSQTPMELVIPQNIRGDYIDYKIWAIHKDSKVMDKMIEIFGKEENIYYKSVGSCMAFGTAFNSGWIETKGIIEGRLMEELSQVTITSSIPADKVKEIKTTEMVKGSYRIIKEELPLEFDENRSITDRGLKDILINLSNNGIVAEVESYVKLEDGSNIVWME